MFLSLIFRFKFYSFRNFYILPTIIGLIWLTDVLQLMVLRGIGFFMLTTYVLLALYAYYIYVCIKHYTDLFSSYEKAYELVLKPYVYFSIFNVLIVLLAFILITNGLIDIDTNLVEYELLTNNIERGVDHFYPHWISLIRETQYRLPLLGEIPMITGLTHEPHVLCFLIFPSLFFLLSKQNIGVRTKVLILMSYLLIAVLSMSITTFLCLMVIYVLHLCHQAVFANLGLIKLIVSLSVVIIFLAYYGSSIIDIIILKTVVETGSRDYSSSLILYMLSPESILGSGTAATPDEIFASKYQVGLFSSFLLISFYFLFNLKIMQFVLSKNRKIHFIGLGLLYFSLHMLKLGNLIFHYPLLIYMLMVPFLYCLELLNDKAKNYNIES